MAPSRIEMLRDYVTGSPEDARARYFLATELHKAGDWAAALEQYGKYFELGAVDEGYGYRNQAECFFRLGKPEEGRAACKRGIEAALAHHHEGLAEEIEGVLEEHGRG